MKSCCITNCFKKYYAKGYCKKHWRQNKYEGGVRRTTKDPNIFRFENDLCFIDILDKFGKLKHTAIIDKKYYNKVKKYKWMSAKTKFGVWYVRTKINNKIVYLHTFIFGRLVLKGYQLDHKNRNTFDNTRGNLRLATYSENMCNGNSHKNATSKFKGVSFFKQHNKWRADIRKNGKLYYLGYFDSEIEAALEYNDKAIELHGRFANLNII